jgi:DHA1 family inner membrane transport protein
LPLVVPLLALGTFLMCTTEYLVAGLLPEMSSAFGVSLSRTGLLITAFAVGMIVGAPAMAIATLRLPRRATLVGALAALSALAAVVIGRFAPADERGDVPAVRSQLASLRSGQLWLLLGATVLVTGGYMGAFSYISPPLTEVAGLSVSFVPLVLVGFGIGALTGTNVSGRLADHRPVGTFFCAAVANTAVLAPLFVVGRGGPTGEQLEGVLRRHARFGDLRDCP